MARVEKSYPEPVFGVSKKPANRRSQAYAEEQINMKSDVTGGLTRRGNTTLENFIAEEYGDIDLALENGTPIWGDTEEDKVLFLRGQLSRFISDQYKRDIDGSRKNVEIRLSERGYVSVLEDGDFVAPLTDGYIVGGVGDYMGALDDMRLVTINDYTFVLNTKKVPEMLPETDESEDNLRKGSLISVLSALNYGEKVKIRVQYETLDGTGKTIFQPVNYTIPEADKYIRWFLTGGVGYGFTVEGSAPGNTSDEMRSTSQVAKTIATFINNYNIGIPAVNEDDVDIRAIAKGSSVFVQAYILKSGVFVPLETRCELLEGGEGYEAIKVINNTTDDIDGLPKFAPEGYYIEVKTSASQEKPDYYLKGIDVYDPKDIFNGKEPITRQTVDISDSELELGTTGDMNEVIWEQSRASDVVYKIDETNMPKVVYYDVDTLKWTVGELPEGWDDRLVGDIDSVAEPEFIGNSIDDVAIFQNRLVFSVNGALQGSKTDKINNFWQGSAINLRVDDPINVRSNAIGSSKIEYMVMHNRDLLLFAEDKQFKISGGEAITPQNIGMQLTTTYDYIPTVRPKSIGNKIYFPMNYGGSIGIFEYSAEENTNSDLAKNITENIIGYIDGDEISHWDTSSSMNMIAIKTNNSNRMYICDIKKNPQGDNEQGVVYAWSTWEFETSTGEFYFDNERIIMNDVDANPLSKWLTARIYSLNIYDAQDDSDNPLDRIYLDLLTESPSATAVPEHFNGESSISAVAGAGYVEEGQLFSINRVSAGITPGGSAIYIWEPSIELNGSGTVYMGNRFTSKYQPTRPYLTDELGQPITTQRIRASKYIFTVSNSDDFDFVIESPFYDIYKQRFTALEMNQSDNLFDARLYTGDAIFSAKVDSDINEVYVETDSYKPLNISTITWEGQVHARNRRV